MTLDPPCPRSRTTGAFSGAQFRAILDNGVGPDVVSRTVTLTVIPDPDAASLPVINSIQPFYIEPDFGMALTTVDVQGSQSLLTFQWQRSADGVTWTDVAGETNSLLMVFYAPEDDGAQYRVAVTNPSGTVISEPITLDIP